MSERQKWVPKEISGIEWRESSLESSLRRIGVASESIVSCEINMESGLSVGQEGRSAMIQ